MISLLGGAAAILAEVSRSVPRISASIQPVFINFRVLARTLVALCALASACAGEAPDLLRSARAVRELSPARLDESPSVQLSGVVLGLAEPQGKSLVLHDANDSIYVLGTDETIGHLAPGDLVEVRGHTVAGSYAPFVLADSVRKTGTGALPEPMHVGAEELFAKGYDAQWVTCSGVVRSLSRPESARYGTGVLASPWDKAVPPPAKGSRIGMMTLAIGDRLVSVQYYDPLDAETYVDAEVEVRGICFNSHNTDRQFLAPVLLVPRGIGVRIRRAPPAGPFDLPTVSSRSLFQFRPEGLSPHRVHIDGIVLHQSSGSGIWIRDNGHGFFARTDQPMSLVPGDVVQVAGFPERGEFAPILADAVFRKVGQQPPPRPVPLRVQGDEAFHNNDLVVTEGNLVDRKPTPSGLLLRVQTRGRAIEVFCDGESSAWTGANLEVGSLLSITGLCLLSAEHSLPRSGKLIPDSYRLVVRSPGDIAVLRAAPWWTLGRVVTLLAVVVAALLVVVVFVFVVAQKRIARERALRAIEVSSFSARLAERNRMARDLHDTIAQGLTAISLQLEVAAKPAAPATEVAAHVGVARELVRSAMMEVRSFIRNLRTQTQQDVDLASALEELLRTTVDGASIHPRFQVDGDVQKLAPEIQGQIIRVAQEATLNAVQHSGASEVSVVLQYLDRSLEVTIADNGRGIDETAARQRERLHFGLPGMKERASLIGSTLIIKSAPGKGTRVTLTVPYDAVMTDQTL